MSVKREASFLERNADAVVAAVLFASLNAVAWRRWASFVGDLNREWTTPWRLALGERLYKDVCFYYGPLGPEVEAGFFWIFGGRVGSAIAFGLLNAALTLALLLAAGRRFLSPVGRLALAAVAVGLIAFAPGSGTFVVCYSQSALLSVGLAWLAYLLADSGREGATGLVGGLLALTKVETSAALLGPVLLLAPRKWLRFALVAGCLTVAGYAYFLRGLTFPEMVRYGPLRHLEMPEPFRVLYRVALGLHPRSLRLAFGGLLAGAALVLGWALASIGFLARDVRRIVVGGGLLTFALVARLVLATETFPRIVMRGIPLLLLAALVVAFLRSRSPALTDEERLAARRALGAGLLGLAFIWRTFFWTIPEEPYPPLAAVSALPAVLYLLTVLPGAAVPSERRKAATLLALAPLFAATAIELPHLVRYYRLDARVRIDAPRGLWYPLRAQGKLFAPVLEHLQRVGVKDRGLAAMPELGVIHFLLGVRSPLRIEMIIPGAVDSVVEEDLVETLRTTRPERVVEMDRATWEYGGMLFGVDYGKALQEYVEREYVEEERFGAGKRQAVVYVRKDLPLVKSPTAGSPAP